jgi:hypothetical protein
MSSTDTELRVLTVSHDLDDYDILATNNLSVAVPYKTTETLRKLIWAAMVAFGAEIAAGIEMRLVELARAPEAATRRLSWKSTLSWALGLAIAIPLTINLGIHTHAERRGPAHSWAHRRPDA